MACEIPVGNQGILSLLFSSAFAVTGSAQTPRLRIAAAADLEPVLPPILEQFQQATGIHAEATYQASAMLTTQIRTARPSTCFSPPTRLSQKTHRGRPRGCRRHPDSSTPITYAKGTLVFWTRKDSPLPPPSLDLLRNPALKRLAIANPDRAPYGRAAVAALTTLKLYDALKPRLVTAENIAQAAQFVDSGNADAGLISLTSALTLRIWPTATYFAIPRDLYPPIEQGTVIVSNTIQRPAVHKFLDFLLSPPSRPNLPKAASHRFTRKQWTGKRSPSPSNWQRSPHGDSAGHRHPARGASGPWPQPLARHS